MTLMADQELADQAGIPLRILFAIRRVESAGSVRAVRFEPHLFHRDTGGRFTRAQVPWTPAPGRGSVSLTASETNRAAFERAFRLDPRVAVTSSSWGAYQVLGGHLLRVAGSDPARAVAAFDADPERVGEAMFLSWMRSNAAAQRAAQAGDIETLAELYNGSQRWATSVRRALEALPADLSTLTNSTPGWVGPVLGALAFVGVVAGAWIWRR